jgi:Phosphatidylglycerol lysyltransferase, C-terminal
MSLRLRRPKAGRSAGVSHVTAQDRERMLGLLERFGSNPGAFLVRYRAPWSVWFGTEHEGALCYVESHRTAVVWSDPLCAPGDVEALFAEFTAAMRAGGSRVCILAVQEPVARAALACGYAVLKIGEEPAFDLASWRPARGDPGKKLRWCLNHARRAGVVIEEYQPARGRDLRFEAEMAEVQRRWEASLGGRLVHSFLRTAPLDEAEAKRIFAARRDGQLEAFLACVPVYARDGWFLEDLVRVPEATNGTTELLAVEAMVRLRDDGARFATLGIAPLRGSDEQIDRRARWIVPGLRLAFDRMDSRYHFASLSRYKAKFGPSWWEPRYAAFLPPRPSVRLVRAAISVLDPEPEPGGRPAPARPQRVGSRLVAVQALVWCLASLLVLAQAHLSNDLTEPAALLAPVGVAGVGVAALLWFAARRMTRGNAAFSRLLAVLLEGTLVLGTVNRLHEGRGVGIGLVSLALATVAVALLLWRSQPGAEPVPFRTD